MESDKSVPPVWTLELASEFIASIGGTVFRAGYAPAIFGSVLHTGKSSNDLDILLVRRPQVLRASFSRIRERLSALDVYPCKAGRNNTSIETSIPFRTIFRFKTKTGFLIEFVVINLHPEDLVPQERPFFGRRGAEREIQDSLDNLENLNLAQFKKNVNPFDLYGGVEE